MCVSNVTDQVYGDESMGGPALDNFYDTVSDVYGGRVPRGASEIVVLSAVLAHDVNVDLDKLVFRRLTEVKGGREGEREAAAERRGRGGKAEYGRGWEI